MLPNTHIYLLYDKFMHTDSGIRARNLSHHPKRLHRRYHTGLAFAYHLGLVEDGEKALAGIPASTLFDWRARDFSGIYGLDPDDPWLSNLDLFRRLKDRQGLLKTIRALLRIIDFYTRICRQIRGKKGIWRLNKDRIVQLVQQVSAGLSVRHACTYLQITVQRYYHWKNFVVCKTSPLGLCTKQYPNQISNKEQAAIRTALFDTHTSHWSKRSIYFKLLRGGRVACELSTFYKYARIFGAGIERMKKRKYGQGIRATAPLKLIHIDVTILRLQNGLRVLIQLVMDNYSRMIMGCRSSLAYNSSMTKDLLEEILEKYPELRKRSVILCDGGSENAGNVDDFLSRPENNNIRKQIALVDVRFSNSMIEAVNKRMKYEFLLPNLQKMQSLEDVHACLKAGIKDFNNRPHAVHHGLTPVEVMGGEIPNRSRFRNHTKALKSLRGAANQSQMCGVCTN